MESQPRWDYLFRNGLVIDGNGTPARRLDVAVRNDRIVALGDLDPNRAVRQVDISGKVLCPGFIDCHAHDDAQLLHNPEMPYKISQGVTTVIVGNNGMSLPPFATGDSPPPALQRLARKRAWCYDSFAAYSDALTSAQPAVNAAVLIGHTSLRARHVEDLSRAATIRETEAMQLDLEQCMSEGALGLSSEQTSFTSDAMDRRELECLAGVAGYYSGIYVASAHFARDPVHALFELFSLGKKADVPLVITDHRCVGPHNWGRSTDTISMLEHAARDLEVALVVNPYTSYSTALDPKLVDDTTKAVISWSAPHPDAAGCYLDEVAQQWGCSQKEAAAGLQPAGALLFDLHEEDIRRMLRSPLSMIGSGAFARQAHHHPALWGAFPHVISHFVREKRKISLERTIFKMTGFPARQYGLKHRGLVREGYHADLVIFDYRRIADRSCADIPELPTEGIEWVMVNGVIAHIGQEGTGRRAGRFLNAGHQNFTTGNFLVG